MYKMRKLYQKFKRKKWFQFVDGMIYRILNHQIIPKGGQLAYFLGLSVFPFLIALLNILNFTPLYNMEFIENVVAFLPEASQNIVFSFVNEITVTSSAKLLSISLIGGLWSASSGIRQIIRAINSAFRKKETRSFFKISLMALTFTLALIVMIILLLLTQVFGNKILEYLQDTFNISSKVIQIIYKIGMLIPLLYTIFIFAALYRFSPNIPENDLDWKFTLPGSLFTTFGIIISTQLFTFYVNNFSSYSLTYGSLTGIIVFFLWLYLISIIILIGGEINGILFEMSGQDGTDIQTESFFKSIIYHKKKL